MSRDIAKSFEPSSTPGKRWQCKSINPDSRMLSASQLGTYVPQWIIFHCCVIGDIIQVQPGSRVMVHSAAFSPSFQLGLFSRRSFDTKVTLLGRDERLSPRNKT